MLQGLVEGLAAVSCSASAYCTGGVHRCIFVTASDAVHGMGAWVPGMVHGILGLLYKIVKKWGNLM